jgi:hypothetical protein
MSQLEGLVTSALIPGRLPASSVLSDAASPSRGAIMLDSLARSIADLTRSVADTNRNVAAMQAAWATLVQPPSPPHPHLISFPPSPSLIPSWTVGPPPPVYSSTTPITTVSPLPSASPRAVTAGDDGCAADGHGAAIAAHANHRDRHLCATAAPLHTITTTGGLVGATSDRGRRHNRGRRWDGRRHNRGRRRRLYPLGSAAAR